MHRQTGRWNGFCREMQAEAIVSRRCQGGQQLELRGRSGGARELAGAADKLDFLGVAPTRQKAAQASSTLLMRKTWLTSRDEEHFSDTSARFWRCHDTVKRSPVLDSALKKEGMSLRRRRNAGLPGKPASDREEDGDPSELRFKQHWSKLKQESMDLDLFDGTSAEEEEEILISAPTAAPERSLLDGGARARSKGRAEMSSSRGSMTHRTRHQASTPRMAHSFHSQSGLASDEEDTSSPWISQAAGGARSFRKPSKGAVHLPALMRSTSKMREANQSSGSGFFDVGPAWRA